MQEKNSKIQIFCWDLNLQPTDHQSSAISKHYATVALVSG